MMYRCLVFGHENVYFHIRGVNFLNINCVSDDLYLILMVLGSPIFLRLSLY